MSLRASGGGHHTSTCRPPPAVTARATATAVAAAAPALAGFITAGTVRLVEVGQDPVSELEGGRWRPPCAAGVGMLEGAQDRRHATRRAPPCANRPGAHGGCPSCEPGTWFSATSTPRTGNLRRYRGVDHGEASSRRFAGWRRILPLGRDGRLARQRALTGSHRGGRLRRRALAPMECSDPLGAAARRRAPSRFERRDHDPVVQSGSRRAPELVVRLVVGVLGRVHTRLDGHHPGARDRSRTSPSMASMVATSGNGVSRWDATFTSTSMSSRPV